MSNTTNYDLPLMPTGAIDWVALWNNSMNKIEIGRTLKLTAGETITNYEGFYVNADGKAYITDAGEYPLGIWQSSSTDADEAGFGQITGTITNGSWTWTIGVDLFLDSSGALTETAGGHRPVAHSISATQIMLLSPPDLPSDNQTLNGRVQTTDATVTNLVTKTLTDGKAYLIIANVTAREGAIIAVASYIRRALVYRSTTAGQEGTTEATYDEESSLAATWDCDIDVSGNDVRLRVTGGGSDTVEWRGTLELLEV